MKWMIKISRLIFVFPTNIWMNFIFPQTLRLHFVTTFFSHLLAAMFDKCSCLCMWINHFFSQTWGRIHFFYHSHQGDFFSHKYVDDFFILLKEINNIRGGGRHCCPAWQFFSPPTQPYWWKLVNRLIPPPHWFECVSPSPCRIHQKYLPLHCMVVSNFLVDLGDVNWRRQNNSKMFMYLLTTWQYLLSLPWQPCFI